MVDIEPTWISFNYSAPREYVKSGSAPRLCGHGFKIPIWQLVSFKFPRFSGQHCDFPH